MLDQEKITIGKLKQAYKLSVKDADKVVCALLPDKVFPFALWKKAYAEFWEWSVREAVDGYRIEAPRLREIDALPEEHFPDELCCTRVVEFFGELSRIIKISALENGFDYIIEASYGDEKFPFKEQKESLFRALHQEEYSPHNRQRKSGPREMKTVQAVEYLCVTKSFFDTVVVDKAAAVRFIRYVLDYPFHQDVKDLTRSYAESIKADSPAQPPHNVPEQIQESCCAVASPEPYPVPRSLWQGKSMSAAYAAMDKEGFHKKVITHVLYYRFDRNKARVSKVMGLYPKKITQFLTDAATMNIVDS